ncbi:MAG: cytidylate kinase-like family protein [Anaerolineae bacterium]|nr:cytidylate kinase-like family protein [Anaerolineae bacterium]
MPVVTISRQLGCNGNAVAAAVAEKLKAPLLGRDLINQAARRAGVPELALAALDDLGLLEVRPSREARRAYREALAKLAQEIANTGNAVIVGRNAQVILKDRPDVLHVHIVAPEAMRLQRVMVAYRCSEEAARARIRAADDVRTRMFRAIHGTKRDDAACCDLVINMAKFTVEDAANIILQAAKAGMKDRQV